MTACCKKTLCMLQLPQWRHAGVNAFCSWRQPRRKPTTPLCWHTKVSLSTHIRHWIYKHLKDKKSGDSEDKLSTCNIVMTWFILLKRDNNSTNHWWIVIRRVGAAEGYRKSFTSPVPSLHRHLHEINIESSSIYQGNNSKNNNKRKRIFWSHNHYGKKIGTKSKILTWHISVIWSEIPLLYWLPLIFQTNSHILGILNISTEH